MKLHIMSFGTTSEIAAARRRHIDNMDEVSRTCCTYIWIPLFILIMILMVGALVVMGGVIAVKAPLGVIGFLFVLVGLVTVVEYCGCCR